MLGRSRFVGSLARVSVRRESSPVSELASTVVDDRGLLSTPLGNLESVDGGLTGRGKFRTVPLAEASETLGGRGTGGDAFDAGLVVALAAIGSYCAAASVGNACGW